MKASRNVLQCSIQSTDGLAIHQSKGPDEGKMVNNRC